MKKIIAPVALLLLGLAFVLASVSPKDAGAQGRPDDPGHQVQAAMNRIPKRTASCIFSFGI
jgi:hypothetical protein